MKLSTFIGGLSVFGSIASGALLGFDAGQEFSKAMLVSPHAPLELVLTPDSKRKDVSGLAIKPWKNDIERVYGSGVDSAHVRAPEGALLHIKPLLGKQEEEDLTFYHKSHPGITFVPTERGSIALKCFGHEYPVEQVLAMNLDETIGRANKLLAEKNGLDVVDSLAITVPEFFNQDQRLALKSAAELPHGVKAQLVNDGMSVAIDFALKQRDFPPGEREYYVFYDMGSGSTRASLFAIEQPLNKSEPLMIEFGGYGFDTTLGGAKFTQNVAELLKNKFLEQNPAIRTEQLDRSARSLVRIHQAAEKAKLVLSANVDASVSIESLYDDIDFKAVITRQEFEDFSEDLTGRIVQPIEDALKNQFFENTVDTSNVKSLVLTGGSTRTPIVQKQLTHYLGSDLIARNVNADESSVNGVTIRGIQLFKSFQTKAIDILDRSIFSYGIIVNGSASPVEIFPRGSQYPNKTSFLIPPTNYTREFSIDLKENGNTFKKHVIETGPIQERFSEEICPQGVAFNATFTLSQERIFDLDSVEAICLHNSKNSTGLFKKLFSGGTPRQEQDTIGKGDLDDIVPHKVKMLKTSESFTHVGPMSITEKLRVRQHIDDLNQKDKMRLQTQELLNALESILYSTRAFLEQEDVIAGGPRQDIDSLSEYVTVNLEWLDYESDEASVAELMEKIDHISSLKDKIELYLMSSGEPLSFEQFSELHTNGSRLVQELRGIEVTANATLEALKDAFSEIGLDVAKEFKKLKAPRHLSSPNYKLKDKIEAFEKNLADISSLLSAQDFDSFSREELFELKLIFDSSFDDLRKRLELEQAIQNFKMNELASLHSRRLRVLKKREERRKSQESSTSLNASNSTLTSTTTESTKSEEEASKAEEFTIDHDEL
ncbi:Hsp70 family chaperone LHS1 [Lachancea thermotolerans CBS 6340]|uniref:KLTH0B04290p n=1 Tax=Lachancea thermotolerans (strain ATCC 56472 / CBS 6340 / NRRL Y-8284) TaxID=559295 RepID=C5DCM4_LACTC|nr:KLTH0B04290p [Lachancea thermotolerans CBS 6340]CAR21535.1 KLTH0B04290p [Lachancea thermotolerans CBS 6340]